MISEKDLQEAIAEMQGQRRPDANTCIKLASYLTIKDKMFPDGTEPVQIDRSYSYAAPPVITETTIDYISDTQFGKGIFGRKINDVLGKLDEIITDVYVVEPALYRKILRELGI